MINALHLPALDLLHHPESQYYINGNTLNRTNQHTYLGVLFHSFMSFSPHSITILQVML